MMTDGITLTRDELYVFQALLGRRTRNGLTAALAAGVTDEEAEIRFNSGERTLYERGLLTYTAAEMPVPHDFLIALVGTAALPAATLLLRQAQPDGHSTERFFSRRGGLLVEHSSPRPGLFQFQLLANAAALAQRVQAITAPLAALGTGNGTVDCTVSEACMADFLNKSAAADHDGAAAVLLRGGCPQPAARDLAAGLQLRGHWLVVGSWAPRPTTPEGGHTALLIAGSGGCWLVESAMAPGRVRLRDLGGVACQAWLLAFLQPLIDDDPKMQETLMHDTQQEGEDAQLAAELE